MKISRHGSDANHGIYSIELNDTRARYHANSRSIHIQSSRVLDFDTPAKHNYRIQLSPAECGQLLQALAIGVAAQDNEALKEALRPYLRDLLVIATACTEPPHHKVPKV
jgi:hypothetical protein